jgi:hypothetical protein
MTSTVLDAVTWKRASTAAVPIGASCGASAVWSRAGSTVRLSLPFSTFVPSAVAICAGVTVKECRLAVTWRP